MEAAEGSSSPSGKPSNYYSIEKALKTLEQQSNPLIEQALQQASITLKSVEDTIDSAIAVTRSRLSQIRSTSSAHFQQTLESLKDVKAEYHVYENIFFGKVKEGALVAASHPFITTGSAVGLGFLALKGPRRFLYYRTLQLFSSEEKYNLQTMEFYVWRKKLLFVFAFLSCPGVFYVIIMGRYRGKGWSG